MLNYVKIMTYPSSRGERGWGLTCENFCKTCGTGRLAETAEEKTAVEELRGLYVHKYNLTKKGCILEKQLQEKVHILNYWNN